MVSTTNPKKRKNDSNIPSTSKKAKTAVITGQGEIVDTILTYPTDFPFPEEPPAMRDMLYKLAKYARSLEEEIEAMKPKEKSTADINDAVVKLAKAARSGIKKQMTWKPTCKEGRSKWVYDGVCQDSNVFGALMGLDGPPTFKTKKLSTQDFQSLIGACVASVRYNNLRLTTDVNVQWKPEEGTFKFSGCYGL